jgi:hypothetical protein
MQSTVYNRPNGNLHALGLRAVPSYVLPAACMPACLCLHACLPLPACLPACLHACLPGTIVRVASPSVCVAASPMYLCIE